MSNFLDLLFYSLIICVGFLLIAFLFVIVKNYLKNRRQISKKTHQTNLLKVLFDLDEKSRDELFDLYKKEFGASANRYARKTYQKWQSGKVTPINQTFERFLIHLPKVMNYDLKCEVLRCLMEEYCSKENYELTVHTDDWEETLTPLVTEIIDRPYTAQLPKEIEEKLHWLADGEMQIAQKILKKSQIEEGKIAVSMLRQEFSAIENLLSNIKGRRKITHQLKFPYGTILLNIKKK